MKDILFDPIIINKLEIKNRIYMPAMHLNMAKNFFVTDRLIDFYSKRAEGGTGAICVGFATVNNLAGYPKNIGAHKDEFIPGLKSLSDAIKNGGAKSVVQLNHSGRYNMSLLTGGKKPVAPSAIASNLTKEVPKELTIEEIKKIIKDFGDAALRVKKAGFDAVEILSGTGYLISEFMSGLTNKRDDEYGGSFENRIRFGLEVIQEARKQVGEDFPIIVRMNGNDFMPKGQGREELLKYAKKISAKGYADALCINVGWHEARVPQIIASVPAGVFSYLSAGVKNATNIPVIASHRINTPQTARDLLNNGEANMVAIGRGLIADPEFAVKAKTGREKEITHCIGCAQGCFDNIFKMAAVECLCNPLAGYEKTKPIIKSKNKKNILIIGGGVAGMTAALTAHKRGHKVVLYEKNRLGGQIFIAAAPNGREEFKRLAEDLIFKVNSSSIKVIIKPVDEEIIEEGNFDEIIITTGAATAIPNIEGINLKNVVSAWDVLQNKAYTGKKIVIIGGGAVGVETALFLSEKGCLSGEALKFLFINKAESYDDLYKLTTRGTKEITVVEMINKIGKDIGKSTRWAMMQDLAIKGIKVFTQAKALKITESYLLVEYNGKEEKIFCDTIVIAAGSVSYNPLEAMIKEKGIPYHVIGDAQKVGLAYDAVHKGFEIGRKI